MDTSTQALCDAKAAWRTQALLRAMSGDPLLREQFATDPLQVYGDYIGLDRPPGCSTDAANQLVFAVLSSAPLRRWMGEHAHRLGGRMPGRPLFARQFAGAIASSRDTLAALALMRSAAAREEVFALQIDFFRSLLAAIGRWGKAGSGTEMSPGATSTEMSPGATGTEMSPGALGLA
ncbi:MAG TPA: hemagglutinin, partial [Burkholderiaceae bacterium]|nr:hemagglutinin [Burkholderiaceae bacterium]